VQWSLSTAQGRAITRTPFVQKHWHPALREAGVAVARENGFHALRHYFASALLYDHDPAFTLRVLRAFGAGRGRPYARGDR